MVFTLLYSPYCIHPIVFTLLYSPYCIHPIVFTLLYSPYSPACIVLEMCTCHRLPPDAGAVAAVLYGLKHNRQSVDDAFALFEDVSKGGN